MDYAGEPIDTRLHFNSSTDIYDLISQLADTLRYLEYNKIEHNDIKRQNVLLDCILCYNYKSD